MKLLLILGGLGQLALAAGSVVLPRMLDWKAQAAGLRPLMREVFWTHATYIWITNICLGLLSAFAPELLLDGGVLARMVSGYVFAYWGARLLIQFFYFDRGDAPRGLLYRVAEPALIALFAYLTAVYGWLAFVR